jgi:hypothetical protein
MLAFLKTGCKDMCFPFLRKSFLENILLPVVVDLAYGKTPDFDSFN